MIHYEEQNLKKLLKLWAFLFTLAVLVFIFAPNRVIQLLNTLSIKFFPSFILLPESSERFWLCLTVSLMVTLIAMCLGAIQDISRKKDLVFYILVSKITSTLSFISFFFFFQRSIPYLLGAAVDGSIFLITLFFYRRAASAGYLRL